MNQCAEFIEKWNEAFDKGEVSIFIAENNSDGIMEMTRKMRLNAIDMFYAFKNGDYKYDDGFIYMSRKKHNLYSFLNINQVKEINYNVIFESQK